MALGKKLLSRAEGTKAPTRPGQRVVFWATVPVQADGGAVVCAQAATTSDAARREFMAAQSEEVSE